jgi:proline iminopeptidase
MKKALLVFVLVLMLFACSPNLPANGEFTAEINGVELWYKVAGQGDQVLFIQSPPQGFGVDLFVQTMKPLEEEFKIVYYDSRGTGSSERNPDPETLNIGQVVQDIEALRVHLGIDKFALMGQSMGALVSLNYAQQYQDNLSHLILTNKGVGTPEDYTPTMMGELAQDEQYLDAVMALGDIGAVSNDVEFTDWFRIVAPIYFWNVDYSNEYMSSIPAGSDLLDLETFYSVSATEAQYQAVFDELASIQVPTLVVAGDRDVFISVEAAQNLADRLPDAELIVLEHTNHMPTADNPDSFFAKLTEFLNK